MSRAPDHTLLFAPFTPTTRQNLVRAVDKANEILIYYATEAPVVELADT